MATNAITLEEARAELENAEAELRRHREQGQKLEEETEKLRAFVQGFEVMLRRRGGNSKQLTQKAKNPEPAPKAEPKQAPSKQAPAPTRKLTVVELAVQELEKGGGSLHIDVLTERMIAAGYEPRGTGKPKDAVYATLYHVAKKPDSPIARDRATFTLRAA